MHVRTNSLTENIMVNIQGRLTQVFICAARPDAPKEVHL